MRLARISLAAKYRLLFGVAVLLILAAALYVPWTRMEQLVLQQPFREAQRVADDYFRLVLPQAQPGSSGTGPHGGDYGLLSDSLPYHPRYVRYDFNIDDKASIPRQIEEDPFVVEAVRNFFRNPKSDYFYRTRTVEEVPRFYYAHAVRVAKSCLHCHDEGAKTRFSENQFAGIIVVDLPSDPAFALLVNRAVIIAAGMLAGVLATLVFYVITKRFILAPIEELREVALRVTDGDLAVRSTVATGDEFEQLSDNLNTMLERLRDSQVELKTANVALDQKLGEMAETNVALFEANRVKSEFLANVSHELRTPLTSIIGFAELLREGPQGDGARIGRYAENILIAGRILLEIINDLLDLAKIEAGKVELRIDAVLLDELCATLVDFLRPIADKKNLRLEAEIAPDLPALFTDRGRLRQVLYNLLSNAVKFTPEGGQVRLAARRADESSVRIEVSDTGPGIAPEHRAMIFEKFRQIDGSATREHHGTGLGLAIAKELTWLLNGQIGVDSELGKGATFWVVLPTAAPQPRERPPVALV